MAVVFPRSGEIRALLTTNVRGEDYEGFAGGTWRCDAGSWLFGRDPLASDLDRRDGLFAIEISAGGDERAPRAKRPPGLV